MADIGNINTGVLPNDGTGDPLRTAFQEVNNNFANIFSASMPANLVVVDDITNSQNNTTSSTTNVSSTINIQANNIFIGSGYSIPIGTGTPEVINVGNVANDGTGDPLKVAFDKINNNFSSLANLFLAPPLENTSLQTTSNNAVSVINDAEVPSLVAFSVPIGPYGDQEFINIGALPNDGTGDPLRVAFEKINNNFTNLFYTATTTTSIYTLNNVANQVILEVPVSQFTQGSFQIRSSDISNQDSQDITITSQITNNLVNVKWSGYGTTFNGNALTRYDMDVVSSNVRLKVNPLVNKVLLHFISSTVTYIGETPAGSDIELDGYTSGTLMLTEDDINLATEIP